MACEAGVLWESGDEEEDEEEDEEDEVEEDGGEAAGEPVRKRPRLDGRPRASPSIGPSSGMACAMPPASLVPHELIEDGPAAGWAVHLYISKDRCDTRGWAPRGEFASPLGEVTRAIREFGRDRRHPEEVRRQVLDVYHSLQARFIDEWVGGAHRAVGATEPPAAGWLRGGGRFCSVAWAADPWLEAHRVLGKSCVPRAADAGGALAAGGGQAEAAAEGPREAAAERAERAAVGEPAGRAAGGRPEPAGAAPRAPRLAEGRPAPPAASELMVRLLRGDAEAAEEARLLDGSGPEAAWLAACAGGGSESLVEGAATAMLQRGEPLGEVYRRIITVSRCPLACPAKVLAAALGTVQRGCLPPDPHNFAAANAPLCEHVARGLDVPHAQRTLGRPNGKVTPLALSVSLGLLLGSAIWTAEGGDALERAAHAAEGLQWGALPWQAWSHAAALLLGLAWLGADCADCASAARRLRRVFGTGPEAMSMQLDHLMDLLDFAVEAVRRQAAPPRAGPRPPATPAAPARRRGAGAPTRAELAAELLRGRRPAGLGAGGFAEVLARALAAEGLRPARTRARGAPGAPGALGALGERLLGAVRGEAEEREAAAAQLARLATRQGWGRLVAEGDPQRLSDAVAALPAGEREAAWCALVGFASRGDLRSELPFLCADLVGSMPAGDPREALVRLLLVHRAIRACGSGPEAEREFLRCVCRRLLSWGELPDVRADPFRGFGALAGAAFAPEEACQTLFLPAGAADGLLFAAWGALVADGGLASELEKAASGRQAPRALPLVMGLLRGHPPSEVLAHKASDLHGFLASMWGLTATLCRGEVPLSPTLPCPPELRAAPGWPAAPSTAAALAAWEALCGACRAQPGPHVAELLRCSGLREPLQVAGRLLERAAELDRRELAPLRQLLARWGDALALLREALERAPLAEAERKDWLWFARAAASASVKARHSELRWEMARTLAEALAFCLRAAPEAPQSARALVQRHFSRSLLPRSPLPALPESAQTAPSFQTASFSGQGSLAKCNGRCFDDVYREDPEFAAWALRKAGAAAEQGGVGGFGEVRRFAGWILSEVLEYEPPWLRLWHAEEPQHSEAASRLRRRIAPARAAAAFFARLCRATSGLAGNGWCQEEALDAAGRLACLLLAQAAAPGEDAWREVQEVVLLHSAPGRAFGGQQGTGEWIVWLMGALVKLALEHASLAPKLRRDLEALQPLARSKFAKEVIPLCLRRLAA